MPFPSKTLFPGATTFPGAPVTTFLPPTVDLATRMEGNLFATLPWGQSVFRSGGVWHTVLSPTYADIQAADRFYGGGRVHTLTAAQRDELVAAGFGAYITQESA